jgi:hypothetical protein
MLHNDRMSRWLERRNVWQYFLIVWVSSTTAALAFAATVARDHGHPQLVWIAFGPLCPAIGATLGRQLRKARRS